MLMERYDQLVKRHIDKDFDKTKFTRARRVVYKMVISEYFESFMMCVILLNAVVLALNVFPEPSDGYEDTLAALNVFFVLIFNVEFFLKTCGMGPSDYFAIAWNRFDFLCVMASNLGLLIAATGRRDMQAALSLIRLIRIVRLFKLVKHISALERMFHAFFISLPRLFNVALVLCLMLYMFGVIAVNLFGGMQVTYELNERVNFRTFWHSVEEKNPLIFCF